MLVLFLVICSRDSKLNIGTKIIFFFLGGGVHLENLESVLQKKIASLDKGYI